MVGFQTKGPQAPPTPTDRAGRFAALSLLLLAMLIWLFTALLFARHGFYHHVRPLRAAGIVRPLRPRRIPAWRASRVTRGTVTSQQALRDNQVPELAPHGGYRRYHGWLGSAGEAQPDPRGLRGGFAWLRHGGRHHPVEQVLRAERDGRLVAGEVGGHRLLRLGLALRRPGDRDPAWTERELDRGAALGDERDAAYRLRERVGGQVGGAAELIRET